MRAVDSLFFVLVMLIWGVNFVVTKVALYEVPPLLLVTLRFGAVTLLVAPFVRIPWEKVRQLLPLSITLGSLHFSLMFIGLTRLDAATAALTVQIQVPVAALLAAIFLGDRLGWRRLVGMAIAFAGVAIIAGEPRLAGNYLPLLLVIAASCLWATANIQIKFLGEIDALTLNAALALFATPQLALASLLLEDGQWSALTAASWRLYASVAYQALAVTVMGYGLWYHLLRRYKVNQVMPFTLLVPLFGVLSGVTFLDERLTVAIMLGGALTVLGVAIITVRRPALAERSAKGGL
jgi:O-acetylserine/cysteine efflux transporter